jgi:3',5'-cyclic-AMP phosphodiesterase
VKLIHFSDTHIIPPGNMLYGLDPRAQLAAAVDHINAHHADADLCVVTGDLVHWGESAAYDEFARITSELRVPQVLLIGNHDDRSTFHARFPAALRDQNGFVQGTRASAAATLVFLDTNDDGRSHAGRYCPARQAWLRDTLATIEGPIVLFMHHPPFEIGITALDKISLIERAAFAEIIRPHAARVRHMFMGHVHRPISGSWIGISYSVIRGTNHQVAPDFGSGNKEVRCSHEPATYAIAHIDDESVVIHVCEYLDDSPRFPYRTNEVEERDYALNLRF